MIATLIVSFALAQVSAPVGQVWPDGAYTLPRTAPIVAPAPSPVPVHPARPMPLPVPAAPSKQTPVVLYAPAAPVCASGQCQRVPVASYGYSVQTRTVIRTRVKVGRGFRGGFRLFRGGSACAAGGCL